MEEKCCETGTDISRVTMILACSGGSNVGQLANQTAIELSSEGYGKMSCLAGVGGHLSGFVQSARDVDRLVLIDGCEKGCGKAIFEHLEIPIKTYLVITELGIEKNKDFKLKREEIDRVKNAVKDASMTQSESFTDISAGCSCS